jgi:hypothetical protein
MYNYDIILNRLKDLTIKSEWDNLPKHLLETIGYNKVYYSGVSVYLCYQNNTLVFAFEKHIPYESSDFHYLSVKDVLKICQSLK